ncbi:MAG TPA: DUF481 domain-containing protein [Anditalea sp.]|nr:DUF481 domain-containing protein [Anditalea sp.]
MKISVLAAFIVLIFINPIYGQNRDTLFLKEQPPLAGKLERIRYGYITFDMDNVGSIDVDLNNVVTLKTAGFGYRIQTANRDFIIGNFEKHEDVGRVKILSGSDEIDISIRNLNEVKLLQEKFFDRVEGRIGAGFTLSRFNNVGIYNGDLEVRYDTERLEMLLTGSLIYSQEEGQLSRDRENLLYRTNYYLTPSWHAVGMANYQRNLHLGIARRLQQGGGAGFYVIQHKRAIASVVSGIVINDEFTVNGVRNSWLVEAPLILEVAFFRLSRPEINFRTTQSFFGGITQWGRIRNDGNTRLSWTIINDLDLGLNFYNNYDNRSPAENQSRFDYGLVFEIGFHF